MSAVLYAGGNIRQELPLLIWRAVDALSWLWYLGGLGLGVGYITPVSTIIKWFPDKRGLATGLAIMGFGFASLLIVPLLNI